MLGLGPAPLAHQVTVDALEDPHGRLQTLETDGAGWTGRRGGGGVQQVVQAAPQLLQLLPGPDLLSLRLQLLLHLLPLEDVQLVLVLRLHGRRLLPLSAPQLLSLLLVLSLQRIQARLLLVIVQHLGHDVGPHSLHPLQDCPHILRHGLGLAITQVSLLWPGLTPQPQEV